MSEIKWIKLSVNMPDNRKVKRIRRLPDGDNIILIWVFLLLKAGESNKGGGLFFLEDMPYTIEDLADEFDFSTDLIKFSLKTLEKLNMIEMYDEIIYIKNWEKYQSADKLERIREQNRIRQQRYREKKQLEPPEKESNVSVTLPVTQCNGTDIDIDIDKEYIYRLFEHWKEKNIINHRKINQQMKSHINARLKEYTVDELKKAIDNYSEVLQSDNYYWTHKWTLQDFMKPNNVSRFVDEASPLENFSKDKPKGNKGNETIKGVDF